LKVAMPVFSGASKTSVVIVSYLQGEWPLQFRQGTWLLLSSRR
jgi:hypothetical protein